MSLNLHSLLNEYGFGDALNFFWLKNKEVNEKKRPIFIKPMYEDFMKVVLGLYIIDSEFKEDKINELIVDTYFDNNLNNIKYFLQNTFYHLTNKRINIRINKKEYKNKRINILTDVKKHDYLLFSGGLDSLCGSFSLVEKNNLILLHVITNDNILHNVIRLSKIPHLKKFPLFCLDARMKALKGGVSNTRGLLFFSAGFSIACSLGSDNIFFAEKGSQMLDVMLTSLAYPNKPATKNTNPTYLSMYEKMFSLYSESEFSINYLFKNNTRSETINNFKKEIPVNLSYSCFSTRAKNVMCGICYNCFVRKMSLLALNIIENEDLYEYDIFKKTQINKESVYHERERIIINLLRFYFNLLKGDPDIIQEIELSSRNFFDDPIKLANNFSKDIFLGISKKLCKINSNDLSGFGKKAEEMLYEINPQILIDRDRELNY